MANAVLQDACLVEADLSGAQLDAALLTGADLREANLRAAGLRDARLDEADLAMHGLVAHSWSGRCLFHKINTLAAKWDTFSFAGSRRFSERVSHCIAASALKSDS